MIAILAISNLTLGFIAYYFLSHSLSLKNSFVKKWGEEKTKAYWIYFQRLVGFFCYGVVAMALMLTSEVSLSDFGFKTPDSEAIWWTLGLSSIVVVMNFFASRTSENLAQYPQIRVDKWRKQLLLASGFTWTIYLIGYEILFRGFLLFACEMEMGAELAITINVALYAFAHVHKNLKETLGAIPFGVLLCILSLKTGTIFIALVVHLAIGLSSEWFSIYYLNKVKS